MKRVCTDVENNIIWQSQADVLPSTKHHVRKSTNSVLPKERFWINGATVIECRWDPKEQEILLIYAEDDFRDALGRMCCLQYIVCKYIDMKFGDRILVVHCANGAYFPMLLNERTRGLIPSRAPEYFYEINWHNAGRLLHPMEHILENNSTAMNEADKEVVRERFRKVGKLRMRDKVAAFLTGFAAFIMFTFIFMFIITDEMIEAVIPILIGLGLVPALSVVVTIVFVGFLKLWRTSPIKKLNYKKVVLFHSIYDDPDYLVSVKYLYVYEKINNRIELVSYPVGFNNFTMKDVYYGQMLYKCSIDAENESANMHYFYYLL